MMLDQFAAQIATVDMSYAASKNLTLYDVVTLASMVEKEYQAESDKAPSPPSSTIVCVTASPWAVM